MRRHEYSTIFSALMLLALAVAFVSCNKEEDIPDDEKMTLTFTSGDPDVKTQWNGESIIWSAGDQVKVALKTGNIWYSDGTGARLLVSDENDNASEKAEFKVSGFNAVTGVGNLVFHAVYPAGAVGQTFDGNTSLATVNIPASQTSTTSFDRSGDLMWGRSSNVYQVLPTEPIPLKWTRLVAHAYITLKNVKGMAEGEVINSVTLSFQEGASVVGDFNLDFSTGVLSPKSASSTIVVNCSGISCDASGNVSFWACFRPFKATAVNVSVDTDDAIYTASATGLSLDFMQNMRNELGINMSASSRESKEVMPVDNSFAYFDNLNKGAVKLDSHKDTWQYSFLEKDGRFGMLTLKSDGVSFSTKAPKLIYPRLKKLADGSYIMTVNQGQIAHNIYYSRSKDLVTWSKASNYLFKKQTFSGYTDASLFSTSDLIVLQNGDVLAFASFRREASYSEYDSENGIMMRRSTDNGKSWGDYEVIYKGTTWEPSAVQLTSGQIQLFFTRATPKTGDSGTALLTSDDNGKTWKDCGKVIRSKTDRVANDGSSAVLYTDQMPVPIQLNNGKLAVAFESRVTDSSYKLGFAYNSSMLWTELTGTATGPSDKVLNKFTAAAPYLRQFPSGETVLSYNKSGAMYMHLGDSEARDFDQGIMAFGSSGFWGSLEIVDAHTVVAVFPDVTYSGGNVESSNLRVAKYRLNHAVTAPVFTPYLNGGGQDWTDNGCTEALFIGSDTQAQASMRFCHDSEYLYVLVERADSNLSSDDAFDLLFHNGLSGSVYKVAFTVSNDSIVTADKNVKLSSRVVGSFDGSSGDTGYVIEAAIPLSMLPVSSSEVRFNAVLYHAEGQDCFSGLTSTNFSWWIPVKLN